MKEIPTAEEFMGEFGLIELNTNKDIEEALKKIREFARLHVDAALRAAHSNAQLPSEDIDFILQSYPEQNIR